jgi:tyrosyl-tRNA synthetase
MNSEEKTSLVKRNVGEVITEEELKKLLEEKAHPTAYVGYEPSGKIHLGHMLTVNKLIDLQKAGFKVTVLLADLHANLNKKGTLEEIRETAEYNKECFIGMGLSPGKADFVLGSEIQLDKDYFLNVQRLALETTLLRARRSMDLVGREEPDPKVARVLYPLMQVIDMVTLGVDVAVGGIDQRKIHMLARDNLPKLGYRAPICLHLPLIHGLDGGEKMSSSRDNFISVDDNREAIAKKLRKAYCPMGEVEGNPILEVYQHHIFRKFPRVRIERPAKFGGDLEYGDYSELERDYAQDKVHPQDLKNSAVEYVSKLLNPVKEHLIKKGYV